MHIHDKGSQNITGNINIRTLDTSDMVVYSSGSFEFWTGTYSGAATFKNDTLNGSIKRHQVIQFNANNSGAWTGIFIVKKC